MFRRHVLGFLGLVQLPSFDKDGGGAGGDDKKKTLSDLLKDDDELQEQLDAIVEKRLQRDRRSRDKKTGDADLTTAEREELQRLKDAETDRAKTDLEQKKEYDKALETERTKFTTKEKAAAERQTRLANELKKDRVRSRLVSEAAKQGAIDPEEIADLLERRVRFDIDTLAISVVDAADPDKESLTREGDAMSINDLVTDYLGKKKHLVKAADGEGSGAKGGRSKDAEGAGSKAKKATGKAGDLQQAYDDAFEAAKANASAGNLTRVQKAKRALDAAAAGADK
jgi:hypothetical protein